MIEQILTSVNKGTTNASFAPVMANRKRMVDRVKPKKPEEKRISFNPEEQGPTEKPVEELPPPTSILKKPKAPEPVAKGSVIQAPAVLPAKTVITPKVVVPAPQNKSKEFEISNATMSELIRHTFPTGKLSQREVTRLETVKLRKYQKPIPELIVDKPKKEIVKQSTNPQLIMVNGQLVVDQQSLQVQQEDFLIDDGDAVIDEDASNRYVTSASFRNKKKLQTLKWTPQMTQRFYDGLSYFGTDYKIISYMFPGLTHKHIKLKSKYEETKNPHLITQALMNRKKPSAKLKAEMLSGVSRKKDLEDSMYLNKKPRRDDEMEELANLEMGSMPEKKGAAHVEAPVEDIEYTEPAEPTPEPEPVAPVPVDLPEIQPTQVNLGSVAPVNIRRRKRKLDL